MKNYTTLLIIIGILSFFSCSNQKLNNATLENLKTNEGEKGTQLQVQFIKGKEHNHPTFSIWVEDMEGNLIETLFVTEYLATGVYAHGALGVGKWDNKPGEAIRPATLPYWLHKRGKTDGESIVPTKKNPVADAITGATPKDDFILNTVITKQLPSKFRVLMEINQTWDWNEYWNNSKYPDDAEYKSSCQPALVYAVTVDQSKPDQEYYLNPIGHSHYSGSDGELYTDISTLTTAKGIVGKVIVRIKK